MGANRLATIAEGPFCSDGCHCINGDDLASFLIPRSSPYEKPNFDDAHGAIFHHIQQPTERKPAGATTSRPSTSHLTTCKGPQTPACAVLIAAQPYYRKPSLTNTTTMFEHFMLGTQAKAGVGQEGQGEQPVAPTSTARVTQDGPQSQCPSPPLSASSKLDSTDSAWGFKAMPQNSIDSLVHVLSKQNLRLDNGTRPEQQLLGTSSPSLSPEIPSRTTTRTSLCLELEVDDDPDFSHSRLPSTYNPPFFVKSTWGMDVDDKASVPTDRQDTNLRLRRQQSSHFNNKPRKSSTIQDLVGNMIATGSQCNVQQALTVDAPTASSAVTRLQAVVELQRVCDNDLGFRELEVDEAYLPGAPPVDEQKEELSLIESMLSLRRAGGPVGIKKMGSLQYRGSADSAFRCANVVRSRPRMRRRKTHGNLKTGSGRSSVDSSSVSSPVIPPSLPDGLSIAPPEFWPRRP